MQTYRELKVWQKSINLTVEIYKITHKFPKEEIYGLTSQIRRSVAAIPANLAEGYSRASKKENYQFVRIAFASGAELETHLEIAHRINYIEQSQYNELMIKLHEILRMLNGLMRALR